MRCRIAFQREGAQLRGDPAVERWRNLPWAARGTFAPLPVMYDGLSLPTYSQAADKVRNRRVLVDDTEPSQ